MTSQPRICCDEQDPADVPKFYGPGTRVPDVRWSGATVLKSTGGWHLRPRFSLTEPGYRYVWTEQQYHFGPKYERLRWWNLRHVRLFFGGKRQRKGPG